MMTLRAGDLNHLVYHIFEIDAYQSKMGDDSDIITISFDVRTREAADDLRDFLEKGYSFVLDADRTPGEQEDGMFKVFVEIERNRKSGKYIIDLVDGVKRLTKRNDTRFRYYKNWKSYPCDMENLERYVPFKREDYKKIVSEQNMENYKNFFSKSFVESIIFKDNVLTIKKKYADPVYFEFIDFGNHSKIFANINENLNVNDFAEVIFLTKYIGDYNISKYGNKITLENDDKVLVVKRINT